MIAAADVSPLGVTLQPVPGESLMSLIARHCEANVVPRVSDVLAAANIKVEVAGFTPFVSSEDASALASLFGARETEVSMRMHGPITSDAGSDLVNYFGSPLERRHFDDQVRGVAVGALDETEIHRPEWALRALSFCPKTFEYLTRSCNTCGADLRWSKCRGLKKCDRCEALLQRQALVDHTLIDELQLLTGLLDPDPLLRARSIQSLPEPFNSWDLNAVFDAICELGAALVTSPKDGPQTNKNLKNGLFGFLGAEGIAEGIRFINSFDERLTAYVSRCYQELGSTSMRRLGVISRHYAGTTRKRALSHLVRERLPQAMFTARVPAKRNTAQSYDAADSSGVIRIIEACKVTGLALRTLRRLVARSPTFLAKGEGRGGTILFSASAIEALRADLAASLTASEAARIVGIPIYMVPSFIEAGLLKEPDNDDIRILFGPAQRVEAHSAQALSDQIRAAPRPVAKGGVPLKYAIMDRMNPQAWTRAVGLILSGTVVTLLDDDFQGVAELQVCPDSSMALMIGAPQSKLIGNVSCADAAITLGATAQTISAAVSAGLIDGEVWSNRSSISLESLRAFHAEYIMAHEIAAWMGMQLHQVRAAMQRADISPAHVLVRVNVWRRTEVERGLGCVTAA